MATKYDSSTAKCYAYVGYDFVNTALSPKRLQARLSIVDITNENAPVVVKEWTAPRIGAQQTWHSTPAVSQYNRNVGWFFYDDPGTHCYTTFKGALDSNLMLTAYSLVTVSGGPTFPANFPNIWTGDYIGTVKRGLPGGYLYPTWVQPVAADGLGCSTCLGTGGTSYTLRVLGARVLP